MKGLKLLTIIISTVILFQPTTVFASLPNEETLDIYNQNGIYYYNPSGDEYNCNNSSTVLSGDSVIEKIWNFFVQNGFSDAQTAGIIGNAIVESDLKPTRSSNGSYWGLFQWGGGRKDALFSTITQAGLSRYLDSSYWSADASQNIPSADFDKLLQVELEFALSEKDADWQNEIKRADSPELSAEIFLTLFERAINGESEILYYTPFTGRYYQATKKRRDSAKEVYKKYAGKGIKSTDSNFETGSNITIIGDSITVRSKSALMNKFSDLDDSQINAKTGRSWEEGISIAQNSTDLNNTVIFALGTNNKELTPELIDHAVSAIGENHTVVFVTNYGSNDYSTNNQLLWDYAKNHTNVIVADWNNAVNLNPFLYLDDDQTHPNSAGSQLFADTIYDAVNGNLNLDGCSINGDLQSLVKAYAWPEHHSAPYLERMPDYASAVTQSQSEGRYVGGTVGGVDGIDCGGFVTILVQNSGLEPEYNSYRGDTTMQEKWVKNHNWQSLNPDGVIDTSILQPGDIAFTSGHTFIYVGEIPGFDSVIASASYSTHGVSTGRAPMAGQESLTSGTRWYRNPNYNPNTGL